MTNETSILMPVKNGLNWLPEVEAMISRQTLPPAEKIAVDSGSSDGSAEFLEKHGWLVRRIAPSEFGHGRTRNLLASLARGEVFLFMNQDAIPADANWLASLVSCLAPEQKIVAACSQWLCPRTKAPVPQMMPKTLSMGNGCWIGSDAQYAAYQNLSSGERIELSNFQTVCGAIAAGFFKANRFDDAVCFGEDLHWGARVAAQGYKIAFSTQSRIYHWHPPTSGLAAFKDALACAFLFRNIYQFKEGMRGAVGVGMRPIVAYYINQLKQTMIRRYDKARPLPENAMPLSAFGKLGRLAGTQLPWGISRWLERRYGRRSR